MTRHWNRALALGGVLLFSCAAGLAAPSHAVQVQPWGQLDGKAVFLYTLKNASGMEVKISNYGGTVTSVKVPDRQKKFGDVVLGFATLDGYTAKVNTGLFRGVDWAVWEPDRARDFQSGRPYVSHTNERGPQHTARRSARIRQAGVGRERRVHGTG